MKTKEKVEKTKFSHQKKKKCNKQKNEERTKLKIS